MPRSAVFIQCTFAFPAMVQLKHSRLRCCKRLIQKLQRHGSGTVPLQLFIVLKETAERAISPEMNQEGEKSVK